MPPKKKASADAADVEYLLPSVNEGLLTKVKNATSLIFAHHVFENIMVEEPLPIKSKGASGHQDNTI